MPVYKDGNNGTFYVQCYYRDARGSKRHKTKRGFSSEVEAAVSYTHLTLPTNSRV